MGFDFPFGSEVVTLTSGQASDEVEFSALVPLEIGETYARIIALWHDNDALGGKAPTIEIRSGQGGLTPLVVTPLGKDPTEVPIIGTDGASAAKATLVRGNNDIYLVRIFDIAETNGPWQLRLTNNDQQTLHFVAVSSPDPDQTLQPWMVWGATPGSFSTEGNPLELRIDLLRFFTQHSVTVRNLGTKPLIFDEQAGKSIGGPDSPAEIATMPAQIDPHGVNTVIFGVHQNGAESDTTVRHTIRTNDQRHGADLTIFVARTNFPPPPPGPRCNVDHCRGYIPPPPYHLGVKTSGPCQQPGCGHDERFHAPPGPRCNVDHCPGYIPPPPETSGPCQQPGCGHDEIFHGWGPRCQLHDGCPGFITTDGRKSGTDDEVCAQPGCGHTWGSSHGRPPPPPDDFCRKDDGCQQFLPGIAPGHQGICRRPGCGHKWLWHTEDHP